MAPPWTPTLGAHMVGDATRFRVWAPEARRVTAVIESPGRAPREETLQADPDGFHGAVVTGVSAGDRYRYRLDGGNPLPDPASRCQPEGVHGPSAVVDWRSFPWSDGDWTGIALEDTVLYELHVGTFTPEGTFAAAAERLPDLRDLGVTAIELMPVADFPGRWNWGYDGVAPFAPARCYGHPDDLRRFVDDAHRLGLAVHLDVVYNHLGPDGAYQSAFSRDYYSATHASPWGAAMNFDGPRSQPVRDYVVENGLHWVHEYHIDGLRLDATHAIVDESPRHILAVFAAAIRQSLSGSGRRAQVVAEDHGNLAHMVRPERGGGFGLDGLWSDDFHHQMRRRLAGDADGYFADFSGTADAIARTAARGWFYCGEYSAYFGRPRGQRHGRHPGVPIRVLSSEPRPDRQPRVRRPPARPDRSRPPGRRRPPFCSCCPRRRCSSWDRNGRPAVRFCTSPIITPNWDGWFETAAGGNSAGSRRSPTRPCATGSRIRNPNRRSSPAASIGARPRASRMRRSGGFTRICSR